MTLSITNVIVRLLLILSVYYSIIESFKLSKLYPSHHADVSHLFNENVDDYLLCGEKFNSHFQPEIGNGHIATQTNHKWLFMNGLYNGETTDSHRARIPSPVNWKIYMDTHWNKILESKFCLDPIGGLFHEIYRLTNSNVTMTTYISRTRRSLIVRNISVETVNPIDINIVGGNFSLESPDIDFQTKNDYLRIIKGLTKEPETEDTPKLPVYIVSDNIPTKITLSSSNTWRSFITAIDYDEWKAVTEFIKATTEDVLQDHIVGWVNTWRDGFVSVDSPDNLIKRSIIAGQYYLLSSLPYILWKTTEPDWMFYGISPTGLSHGDLEMDYLGHVFWDMETWMFPAILPFHRDLAIQMLDYRIKMLPTAEKNAANLFLHECGNGNDGKVKAARYPWESARTGIETTPSSYCAKYELHISGDISMAVQQLLWMERRSNLMLFQNFRPILDGIAKFWMCRSVYSKQKKQYEILAVMPPDEYTVSCNNSAFTNVVALQSMEAPFRLALRFRTYITEEMSDWFSRAQIIYLPKAVKSGWIPEYEGYKTNKTVKQADVVLLQHPIQFGFSKETFLNNQLYYSKVTDQRGPAMTWAIFSINYFQLKKKQEAVKYFMKNIQYITKPFYVWTEGKDEAGAVNFLTGIGGYLQNVVYGFAGLRIDKRGPGILHIDPTVTDILKTVTLHNVKFQESELSISFNQESLTLTLLNEAVLIVTASNDKTYLLNKENSRLVFYVQPLMLISLY